MATRSSLKRKDIVTEDSKFQNRKNTGMDKRKGWYNRLYYLSFES